MATNNHQPLLSTQQSTRQVPTSDPYAIYDPEELLLDLSPSIRWFPASKVRINAMYIFYIIAILGNLTGIIWPAIRYKNNPIFMDLTPIKFGFHYVYFSYWILTLQTLFFIYSSIDLLLRYSPRSSSLHGAKERFYDCVFSLTVLQSVVFWAFVFPERIKNIGEQTVSYEIWVIDFISNFLPFVCIITETVIVHHRFAETLARILYEVFLPIVVYGSYVGFSFYAHNKNNHWPYPIQNKFTHQGTALFYVCGGLVLIFGYVLAKTITKFLWSDQPKDNNEEVLYHGSFATESVFSSFINDHQAGTNQHYIPPQRNGNNYNGTNNNRNGGAESLVVGSPQPAYNGYGTVADPYGSKGYY